MVLCTRVLNRGVERIKVVHSRVLTMPLPREGEPALALLVKECVALLPTRAQFRRGEGEETLPLPPRDPSLLLLGVLLYK